MASVEQYVKGGKRHYLVKYRTPDHKQSTKRGFKTKADAELFIADLTVKISKDDWVNPAKSRIQLRLIAEAWLSSKLNVRPTTLSGYEGNLRKYILPKWGNRSIRDIRFAEIQDWVNGLTKELQPSTVRQIFLNLRSILDFAINDGSLTKNPCKKVELPKLNKKFEHVFLDHSQVRKLAETMKAHGDIVFFLSYTGMRFGEMVALRVKDVDFATHRITIRRSISEIKGRLVEGPPKNGERRTIPFPASLTSMIQARCAGKAPDAKVFLTLSGEAIRNTNFRRDFFNPAVASMQKVDPTFPRVTPHDLRHTLASLAVSSGANVKSLQRMLGHSKASITLDTYADLFQDDLDSVAIALDAAMSVFEQG